MKKSATDITNIKWRNETQELVAPSKTLPAKRSNRSKSKTILVNQQKSIKKSKSLGQKLNKDELEYLQKYIHIIAKDPIQTKWLTNKLGKEIQKKSETQENSKKKDMFKDKKNLENKPQTPNLESIVKHSSLLDKTDSRALTENLVTFDLGSKFSESNATDFINKNHNLLDKIKQNSNFTIPQSNFQWNDAMLIKGRISNY